MATVRKSILLCGACAAALVLIAAPASAALLFSSTDNFLAIDVDDVPDTRVPGAGEDSSKAVDQSTAPFTKYLNFGGPRTGLIVTPSFGSSTVQSIQLRTGSDAPQRDPLSYELYGTVNAIASTDHSFGDTESWSLISSGLSGLATDPGRHMLGTTQDFANATAYTSYKIVFPTLRDFTATNSMQLDDVQLFTSTGGGGSGVLAAGDPTLAIDDHGSQSRYPFGERPARAFDGDTGTKYLNFGKDGTGIIVSRADGKSTIVESLSFTTANDAPNRDPLTYELYGTNDLLASVDNSLGSKESWTLVGSGSTGLENFFDMGDMNSHRRETGLPQVLANSTPYAAYRLVFPTLRNAAAVDSMQIADVQFEGTVVPEPSSIALIGLMLAAMVGKLRRRC